MWSRALYRLSFEAVSEAPILFVAFTDVALSRVALTFVSFSFLTDCD
jgi:hypothetical protein